MCALGYVRLHTVYTRKQLEFGWSKIRMKGMNKVLIFFYCSEKKPEDEYRIPSHAQCTWGHNLKFHDYLKLDVCMKYIYYLMDYNGNVW